MQPPIDWSRPQRQPLSGLMVALLKSFGSLLKGLWPFVLLAIFRSNDEEADKSIFMFSVITAVTVLVLIGSLINFFFFRFYIQQDELVIKKGWLKKQVLTIPLQKIQAVHIEQGLLHQLLNIVKLSADTAGSSKTEVSIEALHKPMAEALRQRLSQQIENNAGTPNAATATPLLTLSEKDLLKLSFSANHIEAFFILLSAVYGIFDNLKTVNETWVAGAEGWLPAGTVTVLLFFVTTVLIITLLISTTRIFFKFYGFTALQSPAGLQLKSGLASTRERFVAFQKVQYISWRANWVRRKLGIWLLQYHTAGGYDDAEKQNMKAEVPLTQKHFISLLVQPYHPLPHTDENLAVRVHAAYVARRTLMAGLVPALVLIAATAYWWQYRSLFFLLWPLLTLWRTWLFQRSFRLHLSEEVLYLRRGAWGVEKLLLKWNAAQSVAFSQSLYQQQKGLASIKIYTAAGAIVIPYIDVALAQAILNYGLYKVEKENEGFL